MKTLFMAAFSIIMGFSMSNIFNKDYDYEKAWQEVSKYIEQGLPKSALEKTEEIFKIAESEKNNPQLAKSVVYLSRLTMMTDEKGIEKSIERMESIIRTQSPPADRITASYLAELYQRYFDNYRWEISQRSELAGEKGPDFRTWTTGQFLATIEKWYLYSVEDKKSVNLPIENWQPILSEYDKEGTPFRPTLYEVLADRAMTFFSNYDGYTNENQQSFQVDKAEYFATAEKFIKLNTETSDPSSARYKVISLYKDILSTQIERRDKTALAAYDLQRIQYVYSQSTLQNKDELYLKALENLAGAYSEIPYHADIAAVWAEQWRADSEDSTAHVKALEICEKAAKKYSKSPGAAKCRNIITSIKMPSMQLYGENVYTAGRQLLFAMEHNNVSDAVVETVRLGKDFNEMTLNRNQEQIIEYLDKQPKVSTLNLKLNKSKWYRSQKTEFDHKSLPYGNYALIAGNKNGNTTRQYLFFTVSDLAYTTFLADGVRYVDVSDRTTGAPVSGARVTMYEQEYNPGRRRYDFRLAGEYTTDAKGRVRVSDKLERNFRITVTKGKDELDLHRYHYNYGRTENNEFRFAEFYTDRSIYRPGQVVFFKAILLHSDNNRIPSILAKEQVEVVFRDANYQEVSRQKLTSNDFGSVNGSFTIPTGKLTGNYTLEVSSSSGISGTKSINVEEYKRPTFEVVADTLRGEYQVNDMITVGGVARTLAGTAVDGASVKYRVVRTARMPWWGWWWRMPYQSQEFMVSQGTTETDAEGRYTITFEAIPDLKVAQKDNPVFNYSVEVDITDQRGETASESTTVSAGYTAFSLSANVGRETDLSDLKPIKVTSKGTQGQDVQTSGSITVSRLKEPTTVKVTKYWEGKTDYPIPSPLWEKHFPDYPAPAETDLSKWPVESKVYSGMFDTRDSIDLKNVLKPGVYKVELEATDKNRKKVVTVQYFIITDFGKKVFPKSDFLFVSKLKNEYAPGEKVEMTFGSAGKPVYVHLIAEKEGRILRDETIKADNTGRFSLPVTEDLRGGVHIKIWYIISNRHFERSYNINVPWTNKQLNIRFETFRDKTLPGSKEEYRIKISGYKNEAVAAEMVSAMYDASLDQFVAHSWRKDFYPESWAQLNTETPGFNLVTGQFYTYGNVGYEEVKEPLLPTLIPLTEYYGYGRGRVMAKRGGAPREEVLMMDAATAPQAAEAGNDIVTNKEAATTALQPTKDGTSEKKEDQSFSPRKNLKETVFFFPELRTDKDGNLILAYTNNEALTRWKLMSFAHTRDFSTAYNERTVQTRKELMVFPNAPRFIRDGDVVSFTAKVSNLSDQNLNGKARLTILDAITMQDVTNELVKSQSFLSFNIDKGRSQGLSWDIFVPDTKYQALTYTVTVEAENHTDGEENTIPVVTNRILVTESMPMWVKGNETKSFDFKAFRTQVSPTATDFRYTVEFTSSPIWYAVQALPYVNQQSHAGTQALVDRLYANALASGITNTHPKIKAVFDQWMTRDKNALISNLSKNEELKTAILEETPWVRQALTESEQKRNIAVLFDLTRMADEKTTAITKLAERQLPNGGFPWFPGGRDDEYTTQNVMENIGHLYRLGVLDMNDPILSNMTARALRYLDESLKTRYEKLKENVRKYGGNLSDDHLDDLSVHYLYTRTFFSHVNPMPDTKDAREYYFGQARKYWTKRGLYTQALIGLIMDRNSDKTVDDIIRSLREKSFSSEELGMYWNEGNGFYWYQLPIERQATMIELFSEAGGKADETDRMKIWLLKNKQTNHWKTSKATAAAIYAMLIQGETAGISGWITEGNLPSVTVGSKELYASEHSAEAGSGYIKKAWQSEPLSKDLASVKVTNRNKSVAWGAAYYQYFEKSDKIRGFTDTPLTLNKKYYRVDASPKGNVLEEVKAGTVIKPGDKLRVRIELRVDRQMEYVHMKDMRPSGFEPQNVLSEYKYQGQLGYYESTRDLATHFYFDYLPKGTFVFEYPVIAVHKGDFSAGIATIECSYAPEFTSHSEGIRVKVK